MANLIMKISGLKILTTSKVEPINIEENGTYAPPTGVVGFNPVTVNVEPPLQEKTTTQNGEVVADPEYYGLSKVNVDVPAPPLSKRKITVNGIYNASNEGLNGYSEVDVDVPDNSGDEENSITFYDYDGTVLRRISLDQLPITTEDLPTPPPHEYLIFSEWTHTLEEINEATDTLNVGAIYNTVDNKTYAFIRVNAFTGYNIPLNLTKSNTDNLIIDVYNEANEKIITISESTSGNVTEVLYLPTIPMAEYRIEMYMTEGTGSFSLAGTSSHASIGSNRAQGSSLLRLYSNVNIGDYGLSFLTNLSEVVFTNNVVLSNNIFNTNGGTVLTYSTTLKILIIPRVTINSLNIVYSAIKTLIIPNNILSTLILNNCRVLQSFITPNGLTSLNLRDCNLLAKLKLVEGIRTLGDFSYNYSIKTLSMPDSIVSFYGPGSSSGQQINLTDIKLSRGLSTLQSGVLRDSPSLEYIKIPNNILTLASSCLYNCKALKIIDLTEYDSVPTMSSTNVFQLNESLVPNFKILVKQSLLNAFKTATNWTYYTTNIVGVEV